MVRRNTGAINQEVEMVGIVFNDGAVIVYAVIGALLLGGLLSELRERRRDDHEEITDDPS